MRSQPPFSFINKYSPGRAGNVREGQRNFSLLECSLRGVISPVVVPKGGQGEKVLQERVKCGIPSSADVSGEV